MPSVSHPVEVPRRDSSSLRGDARARVLHEGCLFLRCGRGRGNGFLPSDGGLLPASVRAYGAYSRADARRDGPIGGDNSHEFVVLAETGESAVYCDRTLLEQRWQDASGNDAKAHAEVFARATSCYAATDEEHDAERFAKEVPVARRVETRGIEVGHVFFFGSKYSHPLNATVTTSQGRDIPVAMGSYGVGISRLVAAAIEASHDADGIVWHDSIAPFSVGLVSLALDERKRKKCDKLYENLCREGIETLYDDRLDARAGVKLKDMDLIGLPWQIVVGGKNPQESGENSVELKRRDGNKKQTLPLDKALALVRASLKQTRAHDPIFD